MNMEEFRNQFASDTCKKELEQRKKQEETGCGKRYQKKPKDGAGKNHRKEARVYVGAPYNFVSLPEKVCRYEKELPSHGKIDEDQYTGEVIYQIEAETPICVDSGSGEFYKNSNGKYAIPGNTIRGMVQSNVQILSCSSAADQIGDYHMMYRDVSGGHEKERYNSILGNVREGISLQNVKAGYLWNRGGTYYIYRSKVDQISEDFGKRNYYILNERNLISEYLEGGPKWNFSELLSESHNELQHLPEEFKEDLRMEHGHEKMHYKGSPNPSFKPHYREISYELKGKDRVTAIGKKGELTYNGYVVFSGKMAEKKAFYVVPEMDQEQYFKLEEEDVRSFQIDFEFKKKQLGRDQEYFSLPKEGNKKPVFYIEDNAHTYFGFTPRLRVFYDQGIHDGLPEEYKTGQIDYAKALFGFSRDTEAYKSRLSFLDAEAIKASKSCSEYQYILASPKPSSYKDYLKAKEGKAIASYNDAFELRGVKQYWLHQKIEKENSAENQKVISKIKALEEGSFRGRIRFKNLNREELGLLLWGLLLEKESRQNIGKGKPYGFGRIRVELCSIKRFDCAKAYDLAKLELNPMTDITAEADALIEEYKNMMCQNLGRDIQRLPHIEEFLLMKQIERMPAQEMLRYMSPKEYSEHKRKPLPQIKEVLEEGKGESKLGNEHGKIRRRN